MSEHAGCQEAYERELRRRAHAEARLEALVIAIRLLAQRLDGVDGRTHERLGGRTLGGSVRFLADGEGWADPVRHSQT